MKFKKGGVNKRFKASEAPVNSAGSTDSTKLSKQERRNLNRQKKLTCSMTTHNDSQVDRVESVYKRETIYPPSVSGALGPWDRFLSPSDANFQTVLETSYDGFVVSPPNAFSKSFHGEFQAAMEGLDEEGYYQFDVTQPGGLGTKLAKTFVTRCLVGNAGTTYKYLGLRMFSIPWDETPCSNARKIGKLNDQLIKHTTTLLSRSGKGKVGSCKYNLTLINRCFPQDQLPLKSEPTFEADKCSVSWHADSTLEHFSTIGVYHCTSRTTAVPLPSALSAGGGPIARAEPREEDKEDKAEDQSWRVALRVWYDAEGPNATRAVSSRANEMSSGARIAPAVAVPLPSRAAYFLLDDFNHHHQHAVLAGNTYRYASTHRVCKTEGHTFQSIRAKCLRLLQVSAGSKAQFFSRNIRSEQLAQNELEFEWLRQFYVQGEKHRALHRWWHEPMAELQRLWDQLQSRLVLTLETLKAASVFDFNGEPDQPDGTQKGADDGGESHAEQRRKRKQWLKLRQKLECVDTASYDAVVEALKERHEKRAGWAARESDPLFHSLAAEFRPLACPIMDTLVTAAGSKAQRDTRVEEGESEKRVAQLPRVTSLLNMAQCVEQWKRGFEKCSAGRNDPSPPVRTASPAVSGSGSAPVTSGIGSHTGHGEGKNKKRKANQ